MDWEEGVSPQPQLVWSGNQAETVTKLVRQLDTWHERHSKNHADPIHLWVVIETRQPPVSNNPMVAVQLDGPHIIRLLRQKAAAVIYDKSGQWLQNRPNEGWVHPFPRKGYHLAFLLGSDRRWTSLDSIAKAYVTNDKARRRPDLEVPNVTYRILADAAVNTTSLFCRLGWLLGGQVRGGWFPLVGGEAFGRDVSKQCSTYSYRCMGCVCIRAVWYVVHGPVVR